MNNNNAIAIRAGMFVSRFFIFFDLKTVITELISMQCGFGMISFQQGTMHARKIVMISLQILINLHYFVNKRKKYT